ncbi:hypothetical protein LTR16_001198 [Cryomyces antarcticus]|uniref:DNA replication regulator Sld3 C-terminal domain-containing protein n=1 Tax=Cryomyces antarcticus TaxID=329879 RepID=A0ABR0M8E0_9PEZI|nr:hypothetical protein LTR60_000346 [Cryomyces antarcticus]KAK5294737.1 hypothetical protein LTR16_001198 [Cryomyces antarcticus]
MTRPAFEVTEICSAATPSPALSPPAYEAAQIIDVSQMVTSPVVKPLPEPFEQSSAQEVTQTIVAQYLETLYLSKTSLAYFSKGPLSRARAAFSTGIESSPQLSDLIVFLRSMVLALSVMDRKYRTKLPDTILAFPANNPSEDEHIAARTTRNRNPKKLKLSKEGMFPSEAEYIKRWWSVDDGTPSQATPIEARDQALRRRIGDLRIRESLLQTIIILEILSLEAAMSPGVHTISADVDTQMQGQAGVERKKRPKKPLDLILLVDLLIDKLCIWQSLEQEASTAKKGDEKNIRNTTEGVDAQTGSSDRLRSFCVEVIIPFYLPRLPEQAAAVNKKLGGPSTSKRTNSKTASGLPKPGDPMAREAPTKRPRKLLQRVLTEATNHAMKAVPSLARAATDSLVVLHLKRELSVVPLSAVPVKDVSTPTNQRDNLLKMRFSQREVDLSAMSTANDARMKKKAEVEEKLREAITTLKRPNRTLAVKELADMTEQRSQRPALGSRKSSATTRNRLSQTVQVTATPKRVRKTKVMVQVTPGHRHSQATLEHGHVPPSISTCVLSSAVRPQVSVPLPDNGLRVPQSRIRAVRTHSGVTETPSRGSGKTVFFADVVKPHEHINTTESFSPASPELASLQDQILRSQVPALSLPKTSSQFRGPPRSPSKTRSPRPGKPLAPLSVQATPIRVASVLPGTAHHRAIDAALPGSPLAASLAEVGSGQPELETCESVYEALGWDDDADELA